MDIKAVLQVGKKPFILRIRNKFEILGEIDGNQNLCRTVCQSVLDRYEDC